MKSRVEIEAMSYISVLHPAASRTRSETAQRARFQLAGPAQVSPPCGSILAVNARPVSRRKELRIEQFLNQLRQNVEAVNFRANSSSLICAFSHVPRGRSWRGGRLVAQCLQRASFDIAHSVKQLSTVTTNTRTFLRDFASMKAKARGGEAVRVRDKEGEFLFTSIAARRSLLGAARGKIAIHGDLTKPTLRNESWKPSL